MYYENIRTLLEEEFDNNKFSESQKYKALDILNKLSEHFDKLTSSKPIYVVAAIAFFVLLESGKTRNFKQLGEDFGVEAKTIALKVKEITQFLDINNPGEIIKKGLFVITEELSSNPVGASARPAIHYEHEHRPLVSGNTEKERNIPEDILKTRRNIQTKVEFKDQELIDLLKKFKQFITLLYKDKDYIEIKQFLKLFDLNLYMSGYDSKNSDTEKKFGDLFIYLGFEPKKGREAEKFVHLKDRFGQSEPYTLIKLGD